MTSLHFLRIMMAELYCTEKERVVLTQDLVSRTMRSQWTHCHPLEDAWCVIATRLNRDPVRMKRLRDALQSMDLVHRSNIKLKDVQVQRVRNEAIQRTASSSFQNQSRDPGTMFPAEVLVHILSFLPFREGVNVARVSKIWNRASYYPFRCNTPWCLSRSEFPCISNDVLIRNIMPRFRKRRIRHLNFEWPNPIIHDGVKNSYPLSGFEISLCLEREDWGKMQDNFENWKNENVRSTIDE